VGPENRSRGGRDLGAGYRAWTADGTPITIEGTDLFARMLQHGRRAIWRLPVSDRAGGQARAQRERKRSVKSNSWGVPGLSDARQGIPIRSALARERRRSAREVMRESVQVGTAERCNRLMKGRVDRALAATGQKLRVRTNAVRPWWTWRQPDVVAIKALVSGAGRTGDIRNLEHAAALAWPGVETAKA